MQSRTTSILSSLAPCGVGGGGDGGDGGLLLVTPLFYVFNIPMRVKEEERKGTAASCLLFQASILCSSKLLAKQRWKRKRGKGTAASSLLLQASLPFLFSPK